MPAPLRVLPLVAAVLLLASGAARAGQVRVLASDASGVTLALSVGDYTLQPDEGGRVVPNADGFARTTAAGRARLPYGSALLAIPPGARAVARLVSSAQEETRDGVKLAIARQPAFEGDARIEALPVLRDVEPIRDGEWPRSAVEVGTVLRMRERELVPVQIFPFHYDEAAGRMTVAREMVVRVDFTQPGRALAAGGLDSDPDPQFDAVFASQVANWEQGKAWRAQRPAARDGALGRPRTGATSLGTAAGVSLPFDESQPEVRVRIDTTGVYSFEFDSLVAYGYPPGTPIGSVCVHRHEYLPDQNPPYGTIDLPIEVDDFDNDGQFGPGDRIVVWVFDWAHRAKVTWPQRAWGDAEVVYATVKPAAPRIDHRSGWLGRNDLTPVPSYPFWRRYKRNITYTAFSDTTLDQFSWTALPTYFCTPTAINFETNDLDASKPSKVTVNMLGANGTPHITWGSVTNGANQKSAVFDSVTWSGIRMDQRSAVLPPGALTAGNTNTLRLWGKTNRFDACVDVPFVQASLNSFEVEYWRAYKPINDYLSCNSGTETSDFEGRAGPFSIDASALRIYDVSDSTHPVRLDNPDLTTFNTDGYVRFQDNPGATRRQYVVFDLPLALPGGAMSRVDRSARVYDHTAGDYLIVVPQGFVNAIQPLANLHSTQGLRVVVAPLEAIQDQYNGGRRSSYAIKRFVRYAYNNWNARFVLLVGDGSEDPQKFLTTSSPDLVPVQKMFGPVPVQIPPVDFLREIVPSDLFYTWCLNCTSVPDTLSPSLFLGRLPVSTVAQTNAVVAKLLAYDNLSGDQSWRRKMLLFSDDAYSGVSTFGGGGSGASDYCRRPGELVFSEINVVVDSVIHKAAGLAETEDELFNLSYYVPNRAGEFTTSGGTDTCRNLAATFQNRARATATLDLFDRLKQGRMWWNYQGHASAYVMSHEFFYLNGNGTGIDDKSRYLNDGKPFLFTAFSCHPNAFASGRGGNDPNNGPSLGEEMVLLPNKGAIASWASVGYEALPADETRHLNVFLAKSMFEDPPRDEYLGDRGSRTVLGEVLYSALLANYGSADRNFDFYDRDVAVTYELLGDPATRLSIGAPQSVVTANSVPVSSGQEIRLHTPGPGLALDATLVSSVRLDTLQLVRQNAAGSTVVWRSTDASVPPGLTVTPPFPDTVRLTSQFGGRKFRLQLTDNLRPETYRYTFRTVDRYGLVGSFDALFNFQAILRVGGAAIRDGDVVSPNADLSLLVLSPVPLTPATDLDLAIGVAHQNFTAAPANGDISGREWILTWTHADYPSGDYVARLTPQGGPPVFHNFKVAETGTTIRLDNAYAFPNPFDEGYLRALNPAVDAATVFSFDLVTAAPADVTLRIYTVSGRLIYQRTDRKLDGRWHQMPWNGCDAEDIPVANGIYFYKLLANNGSHTAVKEGRLVKLRRPRRTVLPNSNTP